LFLIIAGIHESDSVQNTNPKTKKKSADLFGDDSRAKTSIGTRATRIASVSRCGGYAAHRRIADTAAATAHQTFLLPPEPDTVTKP